MSKKMMGTVRVPSQHYRGEVGNSYKVDTTGEGHYVFFPKSMTTIERPGPFYDINCELWFIRKHGLDTVAEWEDES